MRQQFVEDADPRRLYQKMRGSLLADADYL